MSFSTGIGNLEHHTLLLLGATAAIPIAYPEYLVEVLVHIALWNTGLLYIIDAVRYAFQCGHTILPVHSIRNQVCILCIIMAVNCKLDTI